MNIRWLIDKISLSSSNYPEKVLSCKNRIYTFINPYSYLILRKSFNLLKRIDGIFVDGISMCLWIRCFWGRKISRRSFDMTSVAKMLFKRLNKNGQSIYFIGSRKNEIEKAMDVIKYTYPEINIVGFRDGYIKDENDKKDTISKLLKLNPDYLIIGMGTPKQEQFALEVNDYGYKGIIFTCGGFIHQTTEGINYYPEWINKYNLRGLYRQFKEKGIMRRNYDTFIVFPLIFFIDTIQSYLNNKKKNY